MTCRRRNLTALGVLLIVAVTVGIVLATPANATGPVPPAPIALASDPDQTGVRYSTYQGKFFAPVDEMYRQCVVGRESNGHYFSVSSGGHRGAYQLTPALARGAAWMMTAELKVMFPDRWRLIRNTLRDNPASTWARPYQDQAFWTVWNWDGPRSGRHHWVLAGTRCMPGMSS